MNTLNKSLLLASTILSLAALTSNASEIRTNGRAGYQVVASPVPVTTVAVYTGDQYHQAPPNQAVRPTIQSQGRSGYVVRDSR